MNHSPTVFLVDDDESILRALSRLIESAGYRVQPFPSAEAFLSRGGCEQGSCLVLDVSMPGMGGIELQDRLSADGLNIPIVFITGHGDIPTSVRAIKAGAIDFLPKPFEDSLLLSAISSAIERHAAADRLKKEVNAIQACLATLTAREHEVMLLVVTGMLNKQIAFKLGVSEKTVKVHRARVMSKMMAGSVAELVRLTEKLNSAAEQNSSPR